MELEIEESIREKFPELKVLISKLENIKIKKESEELEKEKERVVGEIRDMYDIEKLKHDPTIRAYRNFFWTLGIDPTKIRPASEALIRRILSGKSFPKINTGVDSYNLASIKTSIPLAAFDAEKIKGELKMRWAMKGEEFYGIGMIKPIILKGNEVVIHDKEKAIAIYPYRDAEVTKLTLNTNKILLLSCGAPGVEEGKLVEAIELALKYIQKFCSP